MSLQEDVVLARVAFKLLKEGQVVNADHPVVVLEDIFDSLLETVLEYENCITWDTTCKNCAKLMDTNYEQYMKIQKMREALEGLKGEEEVNIHNFKTVRTTSYYVLNRRIDEILEETN